MEWKEAFNYGLPTVLLLFVLGGLWKIIVWGKTSVVEPLLKSHLELIETLKESLPITNQKLGEIVETTRESCVCQEKQMRDIAESAKAAADTAKIVASTQEKQMNGLQQSMDNQTILVRNAIEKQTQVIKDKP